MDGSLRMSIEHEDICAQCLCSLKVHCRKDCQESGGQDCMLCDASQVFHQPSLFLLIGFLYKETLAAGKEAMDEHNHTDFLSPR